MAANTSHIDIGAIQRREAADGSPAPNTSYVDVGAIQREEAAGGGGFVPYPRPRGIRAGVDEMTGGMH